MGRTSKSSVNFRSDFTAIVRAIRIVPITKFAWSRTSHICNAYGLCSNKLGIPAVFSVVLNLFPFASPLIEHTSHNASRKATSLKPKL